MTRKLNRRDFTKATAGAAAGAATLGATQLSAQTRQEQDKQEEERWDGTVPEPATGELIPGMRAQGNRLGRLTSRGTARCRNLLRAS